MKRALVLHILLAVFRNSGSFELKYQSVSYATVGQPAFLECEVPQTYEIKELRWFRNDDETIYYYDPTTTDVALMDRAKRSKHDNTSLIINPSQLSDEGVYKCRIDAWHRSINSTKWPVPISTEVKMTLRVNVLLLSTIITVPPANVELTHLTSGRNLSLRCKADGAKPPATIQWTKTSSEGEETVIYDISKKTQEDPVGNLYDTTGILFYELEENEHIARISCVVTHKSTNTTIHKDIVFVSPAIQNGVKTTMEKFADDVIFSSLENQNMDDETVGLVKISADPAFEVLYNTSLTLKASAPDIFPKPSYLWWTGDQTGITGAELSISNLKEDKTYYVLVENPLGRVVLSVPVYASYSVPGEQGAFNNNNTGTEGDSKTTAQAGLDGGTIAAIVIGSLLGVLLIAFVVWYCLIRDKTGGLVLKTRHSSSSNQEEAMPFRPSDKPLMRTTSTQTLEGRRSRREPSLRGAASADDIINQAPPHKRTPPPGYASKERQQHRQPINYDESAGSSSEDNLRSAHGGDDTTSERSLVSSEGQVINGRTDIV